MVKKIFRAGLGFWAYPIFRYLRRRALLHVSSAAFNERSVEYRFAFEAIQKNGYGHALDVGTGESAFPALLRSCGLKTTAIDNIRDYWTSGLLNFSWWVNDHSILRKLDGKYDYIFLISTLEHIVDYRCALINSVDALNPGGRLIVTSPFGNSYIANVYEEPDSWGHGKYEFPCQVFSDETLIQSMKDAGMRLDREEYWSFWTGPLWSLGEKRPAAIRASSGAESVDLGLFEFVKQ